MLRYSVVVLSIVVSIIAKAQYNPYYYDNPYPSNHAYPASFRNAAPSYYDLRESRKLLIDLLRSTSTSTTTCTIYTTSVCGGKRKRSVIGDVEDDSAILPTGVNQVETTPVAEMSSRMEREANPQYAYFRGSPLINYPYYNVEPTLRDNYFPHSPLPLLYNRPQINAADTADPRLFGYYYSTTTTITTVSSTPNCYFSSGFNRCS